MFTFTIKDVLDFISYQEWSMKVSRYDEKYDNEFKNFCSVLIDVIAEENGISREQIWEPSYSFYYILGKKAHEKFLEFQLWALKNDLR